MNRRSTSAEYTHFGGDVTAQVNSSHGVRLSGGSAGGIIESVGDDTNVGLVIRAQGGAGITIGNSSQAVTLQLLASTGITSTHINLQSSRVQIGTSGSVAVISSGFTLNSTKMSFGGSTTNFVGIRRVFVEFTVPTMAINSGAVEGDIAVSGITTNSIVIMQPRVPLNSTVAGVLIQSRCSTAGQLHLTYHNAGTTLTGSTMSAYMLIFDLPAAVP